MSLIARLWFGKTHKSRAKEYVEYVRETGVKELTSTEGNRGVLVLSRPESEPADIGVISFWQSLRDVERFAGRNVNRAVYYERDSDYLLSQEPELLHYEVPAAEGLQLPDTGRNGDSLAWAHKNDVKPETPYPGVRIHRLWKGKRGISALLVEIDAGCKFLELDVHEPGPEEVYVVSGNFNDGVRDYPAGSFIHNPAGSSHVPQSKTGCVLFVFYPEG